QDVGIGLPRPATAGRDQLRRMLGPGDDEGGGDRASQVPPGDPNELCPMHVFSLAFASRWATRNWVRNRTFEPRPAGVLGFSRRRTPFPPARGPCGLRSPG